MRIPGWAWLVGLLFLADRSRPHVNGVDDQAAPPANPDGSPMGDAPPVYAYLYQLPQDSFTTTRMATGPDLAHAQEMGVFGTPDAAVKLAVSKGWRQGWSGVKQLQQRPGA